MARTKNYTPYRLVTPPHMDVTIPFKTQTDALDEAKKRGVYHRTMLYVQKLDDEWMFLYDSADDKEVERKRKARDFYLEHSIDPAVHTMLCHLMKRNPIEYYARRPDCNGMWLKEIFIADGEDELPYIRHILNSEDFVCWPGPNFTSREKSFLRNLAPFGDDATPLMGQPPKQMELFKEYQYQ